MSYKIDTTDGELIAVDKGTYNGRNVVQSEDGRLWEALPNSHTLVPYDGEVPITMDAENPPKPKELSVGDKIGLGMTEGVQAGSDVVWGDSTEPVPAEPVNETRKTKNRTKKEEPSTGYMK